MILILVIAAALAAFVVVGWWSLGSGRRYGGALLGVIVIALQPILWWVFLSEWQTRLRVTEGAMILAVSGAVAWVTRRAVARLTRRRVLTSFREPGIDVSLWSAPSQPPRSAVPPRQFRRASTATTNRERAAIGRVFVSYRRDDSADVVGRIYDRLVQGFGADHVFKDVDSIGLGIDFRAHLQRAVDACAVQLVVIGPGWSSAADSTGQRRLDDPRDYVRLEIEAALARDIPVIPVLVRGARIPPEHVLPPVLAPLAYRNAIEVRADPDFHRDMDRLMGALERMFESGVA